MTASNASPIREDARARAIWVARENKIHLAFQVADAPPQALDLHRQLLRDAGAELREKRLARALQADGALLIVHARTQEHT